MWVAFLGVCVIMITQKEQIRKLFHALDAVVASRPAEAPVDTRVVEEQSDPFLIQLSKADEQAAPEATTDGTPAASGETALADPTDFPGVNRAFLDPVRDGTPRRRSAEFDGFYHLFQILDQRPQADLIEHMQRTRNDFPVTFTQLFRQPEAYRGKLIRFEGVATAVFPRQAPENKYGIKNYYEVWLRSNDRQDVLLALVLHLPENFPESTVLPDQTYAQIEEPVTVVGFFYKLHVYAAEQGVSNAPLVLARQVDWTPRIVVAPVEPPTLPGIAALIGGALALGVIVAAGLFIYGGRQATLHAKPIPPPAPGELDQLAKFDLGPVSVEADLTQLAKTMPDEPEVWETLAEADDGRTSQPARRTPGGSATDRQP